MRTRRARTWRSAVVVGFLVLTSASAAVANERPRPFSATIEGNANPVFMGCTIVNDETGTGQALHLGAIALVTHEVVDLCSNPPLAVINGQFVMTAANGDQVFGVYQTLAELDFAANQVTAAGRWTITGGTGRFADASGEGEITAVGSLSPPFEVTGGFFGRIAY